MFKATPNPPETDPTSNDPRSRVPKGQKKPPTAHSTFTSAPTSRSTLPPKARPIYMVDPTLDAETLLVEASESLSSANAMAGNIANSVKGPERTPLLALQQLIMLNELLVNRLLDKMKLPQ